MTAPIALFVYNRLKHTQLTAQALQQNDFAERSDLFIFADGPKSDKVRNQVNEVRAYLKTITGFKSVTITEREKNFGLANSIISGVTHLVEKFGKVIVLEDDLVTSLYFLKYMNDALELYANEERVVSVHGYVYPTKATLPETFFLRGADCWGWATWDRGWKLFDFDARKLLAQMRERHGEREFDFDGTYPYIKMLKKQAAAAIDSWAICWYASAFLKNKLTLYPGRSLVNHIGVGETATHIRSLSDRYQAVLSATPMRVERIPLKGDTDARKAFGQFFKESREPFPVRGIRVLQRIYRRARGSLGVSS